MNLSSADFFLCRLAYKHPRLLQRLGGMETASLRDQLREIGIDRPVFIAGLARSGTTILLNLLSKLDCVGTHQYRDFPFLFTPYWWSLLTERLGHTEATAERPHKDRIAINRQSPDAFEEPIWAHFFPFVHDAGVSHILTTDENNEAFNAFFSDHLRKILLLRGGSRYVSKGNYNITRIKYLAALFPDAKFVIPIRHPIDHVYSLVRQHSLFNAYSRSDPRVPYYLRAAGHFEFGPQRLPINIDSGATRRISDEWARGNDAIGYAVTWATVYSYVSRLILDGGTLGERIRLLRYEDLCRDPSGVVARTIRFCDFVDEHHVSLPNRSEVSAPPRSVRPEGINDLDTIWRETADLARLFGYERDGSHWFSSDLDESTADRLSII